MNTLKRFVSEDYNYLFNKKTGFFSRWGKEMKDDPEYSPYGPEILDIEISTACSKACSHCYKSNTATGKNMSFETFKKLFHKFPSTLTQIAFGIGDINANPDLKNILSYTREKEIIPNITINGEGLTDEWVEYFRDTLGAIAVSHYSDDTCFDAVKKLTDSGMKQVNIHALLSEETYGKCVSLMLKSKTDKRLKDLNAIVFLLLKPKGDRNRLTCIKSQEKYNQLVETAFNNKIRIGFDSCSAPSFMKAIKDRPDFLQLAQFVEPCESTLFSYYINVEGLGFPCSFCEGLPEFSGIHVLECQDFLKEVWFNGETEFFRDVLISTKDCLQCRNCPVYNLEMK